MRGIFRTWARKSSTCSRGEATHAATIGGMKSDFAVGWDWSYNRQTRFPLSVAGPFDSTNPYAPAASYFYSTPGIVPGFVPGATNQLRTLALFAEMQGEMPEAAA